VRTGPGLMEMLSEAYLGSRHAAPRFGPSVGCRITALSTSRNRPAPREGTDG